MDKKNYKESLINRLTDFEHSRSISESGRMIGITRAIGEDIKWLEDVDTYGNHFLHDILDEDGINLYTESDLEDAIEIATFLAEENLPNLIKKAAFYLEDTERNPWDPTPLKNLERHLNSQRQFGHQIRHSFGINEFPKFERIDAPESEQETFYEKIQRQQEEFKKYQEATLSELSEEELKDLIARHAPSCKFDLLVQMSAYKTLMDIDDIAHKGKGLDRLETKGELIFFYRSMRKAERDILFSILKAENHNFDYEWENTGVFPVLDTLINKL